jgi:1,4-dihydroxy-2-naphthoate octaprenyltransferase
LSKVENANKTVKSVNNNFKLETVLKFIKLGKPQFAVGLFFYFSLGALLAMLFGADFVLSKFILGFAIVFLSTWAVHYHNDYFDFEADHHGTPTAISGGSGILIEHPEWKNSSKIMAITLIALSIAISIVFTVIFSYPLTFILFVILANLLAWFYAAPPFKLSYRGYGEFGNTAIGLMFPGLGFFAIMGTLTVPFFVFAIPMLFLQLLFTMSVEIPDMEGDKAGGKMTWIASRGREFGFRVIAISGLLATLSFLVINYTNLFPSIIDFRIVAVISLIPLSLGLFELIKNPSDKPTATKLCIYNLAGIFTAVILINLYFVYLMNII